MGFLWLPGNYGLMRLHRESGRIQVFFKRDGIADNEFNALSHYQAPDGRLYFGGVNGITAFYPENIPMPDSRTPQLRLIEARTFQIKSGEFVNHLQQAYDGKPVVVTPQDDYLDIRVSPLVYEDVNRIKYSWKLDGYSDQWVQQQEPLIRLHNLPYGKHQLRVRYSMQGNIWSENELVVPVFVERPFYLSWPFLTMLIFCTLGIAWGTGSWRAAQLRKANLQLEQEVKSRTRQIEADKQVIEQQALELRSLDEVKSRFFANITHELRTPLTLIIGPLERLMKENIGSEPNPQLNMIHRSALKLLNLVEELLDLSKMESNKLYMEEKPVHFYSLLSRTVSVFAPHAEHRNIKLNCVYQCPHDSVLMIDAGKWEKIINNLIGNALKFTPGGGLVTVAVSYRNDIVELSVSDTGQGIEAIDLPLIFERYYQAKGGNNSLQGGAGIGLSLSREYARLFGGDLIVESTPGKGSIFTVKCPVKQVSGNIIEDTFTEIISDEKIETTLDISQNRDKFTVLIVEDNQDMVVHISEILSDKYNLITAENGKIACRMVENHPIDIILSDIMMPEMDGFQLLQTVKEIQPDLPFIMLTARVETPDRLHALRLGVDDYLTKPFLEEELIARLDNLLQRYEVRREMRKSEIGGPLDDSTREEKTISYDQKWLTELEEVLNNNLGNSRFNPQSLADEMNVSRRNLHYKIKAYTGLTPNQYIIETRLIRAKYLLEAKIYRTVAEVCYSVGMKNTQHFSKLIKERFGKSPSEYFV